MRKEKEIHEAEKADMADEIARLKAMLEPVINEPESKVEYIETLQDAVCEFVHEKLDSSDMSALINLISEFVPVTATR